MAWMGNFWKPVGVGRIVRLSSFIRKLPAELWLEWKPGSRPILVYDGAGAESGRFVLGARYNLWHPRERFPGEHATDQADELSRTPLREMFQ